MAEPETMPDAEPADEPTLTGEPIGKSKPDEVPAPFTDPTITELQDRRRPLP